MVAVPASLAEAWDSVVPLALAVVPLFAVAAAGPDAEEADAVAVAAAGPDAEEGADGQTQAPPDSGAVAVAPAASPDDAVEPESTEPAGAAATFVFVFPSSLFTQKLLPCPVLA